LTGGKILPARDHLRGGGSKRLVLIMSEFSSFKLVVPPLQQEQWDHIWYEVLGSPVICHWREHGRIQICWIVISGPRYKTPTVLLTEERNNDAMLLWDDAIGDLILRLWLGPTHGMEELASLGGALDDVESGGAMQSSRGRFWFTEGKAERGRRPLLKAVFSRVRRQDAESTDSGGPHMGMRKTRERIIGLCTPDTILTPHAAFARPSTHAAGKLRCPCANIWFSYLALHSAENSLMQVLRCLWSALEWCIGA
jgi:hypothetical protein